MPDGVAVSFQGLNQFRRDLRRVDPKWGQELTLVNYAAASLVRVEAIRRAPRGTHEGGGTVAPIASTIAAHKRQNAAVVAIGGARSPHAVVTEFGGSIPRRGADKQKTELARRRRHSFRQVGIAGHHLTRVQQQPYLYPAIDAKRDQVLALYRLGIDRIMGEAFGK